MVAEQPELARLASMRAYAWMALLLRTPVRDTEDEKNTGLSLRTILKERIAQAEIGDDEGVMRLLKDYLNDLSKVCSREMGGKPAVDSPGHAKAKKIVSAVHTDCVARGRNELRPQELMPKSEETRKQLLALAAREQPAEQAAELRTELQAAEMHVRRAKVPKKKSIRSKVFGPSFKAGSAPGPSSIRNCYIKALANAEGGVEALQAWMDIEVHNWWLDDDHYMWHAAILHGADSGAKPAAQGCDQDGSAEEARGRRASVESSVERASNGEPPQRASNDVLRERDEDGAPDAPSYSATTKVEPLRKVRPLGQSDALLKLLETTAIEEELQCLLEKLEPKQQGVGTKDGVIIVVKLLRQWIEDIEEDVCWEELLGTVREGTLCPNANHEAILELDITNAFGSYYWASALRNTLQVNTRIAAMAAAQWSRGHTVIWQSMPGGNWAKDGTARGGVQGSRLSQVLFAIDIEATLDSVPMPDVRRVAISDDQYLAGSIVKIAEAWPHLVHTLAAHGYELAAHKCKYVVPAWDEAERHNVSIVLHNDDLHSSESTDQALALEAFMKQVTRQVGFLKMLGSAAQGKWETVLGPYANSVEPTATRLEKAMADLQALLVTVREGEHDYLVQAGWTIMAKSICHALDYEMRILPWEILEPYAQRLREGIRKFADAVLGSNLTPDDVNKIELPGPLGGLSLTLPSRSKAMAAFVACEDALRCKVSALATKLGRPPERKSNDEKRADDARSSLAESGIKCYNGCVQFSEEAAKVYESGPWAKDTPLKDLFDMGTVRSGQAHAVDASPVREGRYGSSKERLRAYSKICRGLDSLMATRLHASSDSVAQTTMLSAGGPSNGSVWAVVPTRASLRIPNAKWVIATKLRLSLLRLPCAGLTCHLCGAESDEYCGSPLDTRLLHPLLCGVSSASKLKAHNGIVGIMARYLSKTGANATIESAIPELFVRRENGQVAERYMDVEAKWPTSQRYLLDVTVRSPFATKLAHSNSEPGEGAAAGDADKLKHYGASVNCLAWEQLGRPSPLALDTLQVLKRQAYDHGYGSLKTSHVLNLRALRSDVEAHLYTCMADRILQAIGTERTRLLDSSTGVWARHGVQTRGSTEGLQGRASTSPKKASTSSRQKASAMSDANVTASARMVDDEASADDPYATAGVRKVNNGASAVDAVNNYSAASSAPRGAREVYGCTGEASTGSSVSRASTGQNMAITEVTLVRSGAEDSEWVSYNATVPPSADRASIGLAAVAPVLSVPVRKDSTGIAAQATVPPSSSEQCSEGVSYNATVPPPAERASNGLAAVASFPSVPVRRDSTGIAAQATEPPSARARRDSTGIAEDVSYSAPAGGEQDGESPVYSPVYASPTAAVGIGANWEEAEEHQISMIEVTASGSGSA